MFLTSGPLRTRGAWSVVTVTIQVSSSGAWQRDPGTEAAGGRRNPQNADRVVHQEDPTRPVTSACDHIAAHVPATMPFWKPWTWWDTTMSTVGACGASCATASTGTVTTAGMIGTENVSAVGAWSVRTGWRGGWHGPTHAHDQRSATVEIHRLYDYVAGDFMWTGIDYWARCAGRPRIAVAGRSTCAASPRTSTISTRVSGRTSRCCTVSPIDLAGPGGAGHPRVCYTNCGSVELFLNGRSTASRPMPFHATASIRARTGENRSTFRPCGPPRPTCT